MPDDKSRLRETTDHDGQRRNPRFPKSSVWSEDQRRAHRRERDATIADAGLVTDRDLDADDDGAAGEADRDD